jgi:hypothetical protein
MLKKILGAIVGIVVLLAVVGVLLPRHVQVQRSVTIDRPASMIFATVNSFQLFPKWSPWQDLDPKMHQTMEGPRDGVGAKLVWSGNDKVGSGTQLITAAIADRSVASDLDFGGMGVAKSQLTLIPEGAATRVTWSLDTDMGANPIGHYFGLMMDRMIGTDFAKGLGNLKSLVESMPNVDIARFSADEVNLTAAPVLLVSETSAPDSIGKAYGDGYTKKGKYMAKNKLRQAGAPFGIDGTMTPTSFSFEAGIPVDRADAAAADGVRPGLSYAGKALKTTHVGAYEKLPMTHEKLLAYSMAHGYTIKGATFSAFVDDPGNTAPEKLRTEVYAPID